jgi:peptidoglycan/LPS O-acetylase OafA/YrhL
MPSDITNILAIESRGILKAVLCHPMLVYIGTISYTIYLIHMSALYVVWSLHLNRLIATARPSLLPWPLQAQVGCCLKSV